MDWQTTKRRKINKQATWKNKRIVRLWINEKGTVAAIEQID